MPLTTNDLRELLGSLRFTGPLPAKSLNALASLGSVRDYGGMETVFREGSASDATFVIVSGQIALEMQISGRGSVQILSLGPGDMLAWSGMVGDRRMTATAKTLESSRLIAFPAQKILELAESDHEFGFAWMRALAEALARRLVATRLQFLDLFAEPSDDASQQRGAT